MICSISRCRHKFTLNFALIIIDVVPALNILFTFSDSRNSAPSDANTAPCSKTVGRKDGTVRSDALRAGDVVCARVGRIAESHAASLGSIAEVELATFTGFSDRVQAAGHAA
jgi:hypothetical protein